MNELIKQKCEACRSDAPRVTEAEKQELLPVIPDWQVIIEDGVEKLERSFSFKDFAAALAFTNKIGQLAEEEDHHPRITTEWGKVSVCWWTHKIKGLHQNDFIMAAKSDYAYRIQ